MHRVEDRVLVVVVAQVYHEKVKTSGKIWVHDATPVTALDLMLFGGQLQVMHARRPFTRLFIRLFIGLYSAINSANNGQVVHTQQLVKVDEWLHLRVTPRDAVLLKVSKRVSE